MTGNGFLSQKAQKNTSNRQEYVIDEDRIIVDGLEGEQSASEIAESLQEKGFDRTAVSVRYRIQRLRAECDKHETLEAFHAFKHAQPAAQTETGTADADSADSVDSDTEVETEETAAVTS